MCQGDSPRDTLLAGMGQGDKLSGCFSLTTNPLSHFLGDDHQVLRVGQEIFVFAEPEGIFVSGKAHFPGNP